MGPTPLVIEVTNEIDDNTAFTYVGASGSWDQAPSTNQSFAKGQTASFTLSFPPAISSYKWIYAYFEFPSTTASEGGTWKRSFFLLVALTYGNTINTCDLGIAPQDNLQPKEQPNLNLYVDNSYPCGRLGAKAENPGKFSFTLRPGDVPVLGYTDNAGHSTWITELLSTASHAGLASKPLSYLHLPGSHDAATWKMKTNSGTCQSLNLYEQCKLGVRFFDLRLFQDNSGGSNDGLFRPYHGRDSGNGPMFTQSKTQVGGTDTLLGQLHAFWEETKDTSEFVILQLRQGSTHGVTIWNDDGTPIMDEVNNFWKTLARYFTTRAIPVPAAGAALPPLSSVRNADRRFILWFAAKTDSRYVPTDGVALNFFNTYAWGPNEGWDAWNSWDGSVFKDAAPETIAAYAERHFSTTTAQRDRFWVAQCQITPSLGSKSPIDFANQESDMNGYILSRKAADSNWIKNANIMIGDFVVGRWVERIIWMNYHG